MRRFVVIASVGLLLLAVAGVAASRFSFSALAEPGRTETYLATQAKHLLVARDSRTGVPLEPASTPAGIAAGEKLYGAECASCHGLNARTPTDAGRWMYPRAVDLTSEQVQQYSDRELFWILKNGIRLSGMPAFGRVESDEHLWQLVHYLRTLKREGGATRLPSQP